MFNMLSSWVGGWRNWWWDDAASTAEADQNRDSLAASDTGADKEDAEEEEVDIDLNDPEVAAAAEKIQAGFKGYKARKEVQSMREQDQPTEQEADAAKQDDLEPATEVVEGRDLDPDQEEAAIKIQAGLRGYRDRQRVKALREEKQTPAEVEVTPGEEPSKQEAEEEEVDIDLEDPEVAAAAVKIQAGFKGMMARKDIKTKQEEQDQSEAPVQSEEANQSEETAQQETDQSEAPKQEEEVDIDLDDPEVAQAAIKIQAGFQGMKARKQVAELKAEQEDTGETQETVEADTSAQEADTSAQEVDTSAQEVDTSAQEADTSAQEADAETKPEEQGEGQKEEEEEVDIDLDDPEVQQAAVKIQAGFKGFKARKERLAAEEGQPTEEGQQGEGEGVTQEGEGDGEQKGQEAEGGGEDTQQEAA